MADTYVFSNGTLTIKCFTHGHGETTVATVRNIGPAEIEEALDREVQAYLKRCRFKDCERWISWKFETY